MLVYVAEMLSNFFKSSTHSYAVNKRVLVLPVLVFILAFVATLAAVTIMSSASAAEQVSPDMTTMLKLEALTPGGEAVKRFVKVGDPLRPEFFSVALCYLLIPKVRGYVKHGVCADYCTEYVEPGIGWMYPHAVDYGAQAAKRWFNLKVEVYNTSGTSMRFDVTSEYITVNKTHICLHLAGTKFTLDYWNITKVSLIAGIVVAHGAAWDQLRQVNEFALVSDTVPGGFEVPPGYSIKVEYVICFRR